MKRTQKILMAEFVAAIAVCVAMVVLFETEVLEPGVWATRPQTEFLVLSLMELLVLAAIPVSLRLFKFEKVHKRLLDSPAEALLSLGTLRLMMLAVPLVVCTLCYYLFMKAAFGYLAIILLLCMCFVVPTLSKCLAETSSEN